MNVLEFWYEFASTYSYPAAMRIARLAGAAGVDVRWRPFLLGPIFASRGWSDSPFNLYPVKGAYMWRDLARICARDGLALNTPMRFPQNGLKAARIALALGPERIAEFSRAVYVANFAQGKDIADDAVLDAILGGDSRALSQAAESKAALKAQTDAAIARGIFGAPSFTVGDELFWGNDRLEDALDWAKR
jgi:2-hydroxychromene-2-carboxylate isomerase